MDEVNGNARPNQGRSISEHPLPPRHTRRPPHLGAALALLCMLTGCIHLEQTVMLNGDGSLVATYHYSIAEKSADVVATGQQVIESWQDKSVSPGQEWLTSRRAAQRHFSGSGIRLQAFDTESRGGRRHVHLSVFAEDGPAAINRGLFGALRCELVDDERVRLSAQMPRIPQTEDAAKKEAIAALCDDLYLKLTFKVPGDIASTTAHSRKRQTVVWTFDPATDSRFLTTLPTVECEFEAARLEWVNQLPTAQADEKAQ